LYDKNQKYKTNDKNTIVGLSRQSLTGAINCIADDIWDWTYEVSADKRGERLVRS
jgi:hypothetical protein